MVRPNFIATGSRLPSRRASHMEETTVLESNTVNRRRWPSGDHRIHRTFPAVSNEAVVRCALIFCQVNDRVSREGDGLAIGRPGCEIRFDVSQWSRRATVRRQQPNAVSDSESKSECSSFTSNVEPSGEMWRIIGWTNRVA